MLSKPPARQGDNSDGDANGRYPAVTSVECSRAIDVSSDEGRLLFPHSVVPHPADPAL